MHDDFVTTAQWLAWLNYEHRALTLFIARSGYVHMMEQGTVTATGDLEYTPVFTPTDGVGNQDPVAILGVFETDTSTGTRRRLLHANLVDRPPYSGTVGPARYYNLYRKRDDGLLRIVFHPNPASGTYATFYIPAPTALEDLSDTVDYPHGWEEWIVLNMAARALEKEEGDARSILRRVQKIEQHVEEAGWSLQLAQTPTVRNVDKTERGWTDIWPPPVSEWFFV